MDCPGGEDLPGGEDEMGGQCEPKSKSNSGFCIIITDFFLQLVDLVSLHVALMGAVLTSYLDVTAFQIVLTTLTSSPARVTRWLNGRVVMAPVFPYL